LPGLSPDELPGLEVQMIIMDGRVVYRR